MKRTILICLFFLYILASNLAYADFDGSGFYRLQNYKSLRYGNMIDDNGEVLSDYHAIQMLSNGTQFTQPGSVIYVEKKNSNYTLYAAGTSTYEITGSYLSMGSGPSGSLGATYTAGASIANLEDEGGAGFDHCYSWTTTDYKYWYLHPIDTDGTGSEYFGVAPTYTTGGKYYTTIRLSFSCRLSQNVHAFKLSADGAITELNHSETIPANTPVILQCQSQNASDNRLFPVARGGAYTTESSITSGLYSGTKYKYFKTNAPNAAHYNGDYTKGQNYGFGTANPDVAKMRTLTVINGKLGFFETFASVYPNDLCLNGELAYFELATSGNDANGGMTIVETPTITPPAETEALVGESLIFNATFAAKAQRPNIKIQYSFDGTNWSETTDGNITFSSNTEKNGTLYVRTYNGGIASDVVTASYSFVAPIDKTLNQFVNENLDPNKYYHITNYLTVAYKDVVNNVIYAKDENGAAEQTAQGEEIDFMDRHYGTGSHADHSNWVAVKVATMPQVFPDDKIEVTGKVVDVTNRTIQGRAVKVNGTNDFTPNTYCIANFFGQQQEVGGKNYFFATPQPNEVCQIVWALWNDSYGNGNFEVPDMTISGQDIEFTGGLYANFNYYEGTVPFLNSGDVYKFMGLVRKETASGSTLKANEISTQYVIYPLSDMVSTGNPADGDPPTAINSITGAKEVKGVKYYNTMGIASDIPFKGVNIVVTTYSDGTRTTTKILK